MTDTASMDQRYAAAVAALVDAGAVTTVPGAERETARATSPMTGSPGVGVPLCTPDDVQHALRTAREAQPAWEAAGVEHRARVATRVHDLVWRHQNALLDLVQWENGKARAHAFEEVSDVAMTAAFYGQHGPRMLRPARHRGAVPLLTQVRERRLAKGVVAVIAPWNYPFTLVASDALAALVAGNAVVLKPDRHTPGNALAVAALLWEAGVPRDVFRVVTGSGAELGAPLIGGADYLMFTGSTATGRTVAAQAGERLISASAELGGKNPMIICDDADVPRAVRAAVKACFSNTGQLCISIERLYVEDGIWDRFVPAFVEAVRGLTVSASMEWDADCGPLISEEQVATVERHVEDARAKGAQVLAGGRRLPDVGPTAYAPTVLVDVPEDAEVFAHETFGPVVSLYRVADDAEAVRRANDTEYGLNAAVWTRDLRRGERIAEQIRCGTVNVNDGYIAAWASLRAPMGGMGTSGIGRRHGTEGIVKYTEAQTIAVQRVMSVQAPPQLSEKAWAGVMRTFVKVQRRVGM